MMGANIVVPVRYLHSTCSTRLRLVDCRVTMKEDDGLRLDTVRSLAFCDTCKTVVDVMEMQPVVGSQS